MMDDNNLVRVLSACETMGGATVICSDKTGTLTQNKMTVVRGVFLKSLVITTQKEIEELKSKVEKMKSESKDSKPTQNDVQIQTAFNIIQESIALNSSAFEEIKPGKTEFVGSKTEVALLEFSKHCGSDYKLLRNDPDLKTVQIFPFASERKTMATLLNISCLSSSNATGQSIYRIHVKGASEIVLDMCTKCIVNLKDTTAVLPIDGPLRVMYTGVINAFAEDALRTICMAYKDFTEDEFNKWINGPIRTKVLEAKKLEMVEAESHVTHKPHETLIKALSQDQFEEIEISDQDVLSSVIGLSELSSRLICLGIVGIEDPLRHGVKEAVKTCQKAGVRVLMCTGDNLVTAKSIAGKCGILTAGGICMEGIKFRKLGVVEMNGILPRLQVLARSSPLDKQILVERLKGLDETVAVTGDGTNEYDLD